MDRAMKDLAEELVAEYGRSALDDRLRVVEWLEGRGLPCGEFDADRLEQHMRWLLDE